MCALAPNTSVEKVAQSARTTRSSALEDPPLDDVLERPATILIVSDLLLVAGETAATGRADCRENFFEGDAFSALLEHHAPEQSSALLVLNGDTFDFLRVTTTPRKRDIPEWSTKLLV